MNTCRRSPLRIPIPLSALLGAALMGLWIPASAQTTVAAPRVDRASNTVVTQSALNGLKVMNYYPSDYSWDKMWTEWKPAVIDADFARIAALNANTVRVIVNVSAFQYPSPKSTMLGELEQIITLAHSHGLLTQLTLFDWWSSYSDIHGSKQWAAQVLAPYANDPRIAFVELQNEIDPGSPGQGSAATTWAQQLLPYVKQLVGDIPVTVSVTDGSAGGPAAELPLLIANLGTAQPDFYDIHQYYGAPYEDYYQIHGAQRAAQVQGLALFIGETGTSTLAADYAGISIPQTQVSYEDYQDFTYRFAFHVTSRLNLPAAAPWVLWDFAPNTVDWVTSDSDQYDFGLYRVDGTAKPAAATVAAFFQDGSVSESFNNGFEEQIPGTTVLPALWQIYESGLGHFASDTTVAHTGNASVKIWDSSSSSSGNPSFFTYPIAGVDAGTTRTASVFVKGSNATGTTQICLAWFGSDFSYLGNDCDGSVSGTTAWSQISVSGTAPAGVAFVEIFLTSADNTGTVWFDDVAFK